MLGRAGRPEEARPYIEQCKENIGAIENPNQVVWSLYQGIAMMEPPWQVEEFRWVRSVAEKVDRQALNPQAKDFLVGLLLRCHAIEGQVAENDDEGRRAWQHVVAVQEGAGFVPVSEHVIWLAIAHSELGEAGEAKAVLERFFAGRTPLLEPPNERALIQHGFEDMLEEWHNIRLNRHDDGN